jgi:hypothetical protein
MFYVYGWFKENGECFYIGKGLHRRYSERKTYQRNNYWNNIVAKEEREKRPVLVRFLYTNLTETQAFTFEINEIKKRSPCANLTPGGMGRTGSKHSEETKQKIRLKRMGNLSNTGKKLSIETKLKMRESALRRSAGHLITTSGTVTGNF